MVNTARSFSPITSPRGSVLVVDDNVSGAETLRMLLGLEGFNVEVASNGSEAITMFTQQRPAVVLLDISLPDTDGYAVAASIREVDRNRDALVIAVTGAGNESDVRRALAAGCDLHFTKPVRYEDLEAVLLHRKRDG